MRQRVAIVAGGCAVVLLCHVGVCSATYFDRLWPPWTHRWLCQQFLLAIGWICNWRENWQAFSEIAAVIIRVMPLTVGLTVYAAMRRRPIPWAALLVIPLSCWGPFDRLMSLPSAFLLGLLSPEPYEPWWTTGTILTMYAVTIVTLQPWRFRLPRRIRTGDAVRYSSANAT
jgi:hypothetical protein